MQVCVSIDYTLLIFNDNNISNVYSRTASTISLQKYIIMDRKLSHFSTSVSTYSILANSLMQLEDNTINRNSHNISPITSSAISFTGNIQVTAMQELEPHKYSFTASSRRED